MCNTTVMLFLIDQLNNLNESKKKRKENMLLFKSSHGPHEGDS